MAGRKDNGEGSISPYKKNGKVVGYRASIQLGRDNNGKIIRKEFYGKTKKEAKDKLQAFKKEYLLGNVDVNNNMTFGDWYYMWVEEYQSKKKFNTYREYESVYVTYIKCSFLNDIKLKDLKTVHLNKFYNTLLDKGNSASRIITINARIKTCLNEAEKQELIQKNCAKLVTLPKDQKKKVEILTNQEQKILLDYLDTVDDPRALALIFDFGTGLRAGELLALKWEDIDLEKSTVSVKRNLQYVKDKKTGKWNMVIQSPKNASSIRTVPVPGEILKKLKIHKIKQLELKLKIGKEYNDGGYIFVNNVGNLYPRSTFNHYFDSCLKKAGLKHIKLHAIRHTYASRLFEMNIPAKTIQTLMGHSTINTTMNIYTHVNENQKSEAAEKLNTLFM